MKESKIIEDFLVEKGREDILEVLDARFGPRAPAEFAPHLTTVTDSKRLNRLLRLAAQATGLKQFRIRFQKT